MTDVSRKNETTISLDSLSEAELDHYLRYVYEQKLAKICELANNHCAALMGEQLFPENAPVEQSHSNLVERVQTVMDYLEEV